MFNIRVGPQVGFLLSAKADDGEESVDVKDGYKGLDFGVSVTNTAIHLSVSYKLFGGD